MTPRIPKVLGAASVAIAILLSISALSAKEEKEAEIVTSVNPGSVVMSKEEKAIVADPSQGLERGVILLDETERDDNRGGTPNRKGSRVEPPWAQTAYHRRAKILSREGRSLADVEIPLRNKDDTLTRWWGRAIFPEGRVVDLPRESLVEKTVVKRGTLELRVLTAALPAVEPGCVIDYGWVIRGTDLPSLTRVLVQQEWPVRQFRYRWIPRFLIRTRCTPLKREGVDIHLDHTSGGYLVTAERIPPMAREPLMPPDEEVRPAVSLIYHPFWMPVEELWDTLAKGIERKIAAFASDRRQVRKALQEIGLPEEADAGRKLHRVYDWLEANFAVAAPQGLDVLFAPGDLGDAVGTVKSIFSARRGSRLQIDLLFIALARELGMEASLVFAADRREHEWDPQILSMHQFEESLVAVAPPGGAPEEAGLVAPVSDLPYGEIPWWIAGGKGLAATASGHRELNIGAPAAEDNLSRIAGTISFEGGDPAASLARWSRTESGQSGYEARRTLRALAGERRRATLEKLCGAGPDVEISRADLSDLDRPMSNLVLSCEERLLRPTSDRDGGGERFDLSGPWIGGLPDVGAAVRHYPIVFPFPRTEILTLTVSPRPGFEAARVPEPIALEGPFGRYALSFSAGPDGLVIHRELELSLSRINPQHYAGFREFLTQVRRADRTPLVFVKGATSATRSSPSTEAASPR